MAEDSESRGYQAYYAFAIKAVGYLALLGLARFFYRLYQVRTMVRKAGTEPGVVSTRYLSSAGNTVMPARNWLNTYAHTASSFSYLTRSCLAT